MLATGAGQVAAACFEGGETDASKNGVCSPRKGRIFKKKKKKKKKKKNGKNDQLTLVALVGMASRFGPGNFPHLAQGQKQGPSLVHVEKASHHATIRAVPIDKCQMIKAKVAQCHQAVCWLEKSSFKVLVSCTHPPDYRPPPISVALSVACDTRCM